MFKNNALLSFTTIMLYGFLPALSVAFLVSYIVFNVLNISVLTLLLTLILSLGTSATIFYIVDKHPKLGLLKGGEGSLALLIVAPGIIMGSILVPMIYYFIEMSKRGC